MSMLTPRLRSAFVADSKESLFDFYKRRPELVDGYLEKYVQISGDRVKIAGHAWRFDYPKFLRRKGFRIGGELGFDGGPIYKLEKV